MDAAAYGEGGQVRVIRASGLDLWTESFGDRDAEPVILVAGMTGQAIRWPLDLCTRIASAGYFVIRFDHRDTGRSSLVDFEMSPYSLDDMAADVVGIMDAYDIERAHLIGSSMGGMIAQIAAIRSPDRVASLTSMLSSPLTANFNEGMPVGDLPGPDADYRRRRAELIPHAPADFDEMIAQRVLDYSLICMPPFDPEAQKRFILAEIARASDYSASWNHLRAMERTEPHDRRPLLRNLNLPTLVVHGQEDPTLPPQHGAATAEAIPGADLLLLAGVGHEFPERAWDFLIERFKRRSL